jgi:dipeptide/tripeptide permease
MNLHLFRLKFIVYFIGCIFIGIGITGLFKYILIRQLETGKLKKNEVLPYYDLKIFFIFITLGITLIIIHFYAFKLDLDTCDKKQKDEIDTKIKNILITFAVSGFILGIYISLFFFNTKIIRNYRLKIIKYVQINEKKNWRFKGKRNKDKYIYLLIQLVNLILFWIGAITSLTISGSYMKTLEKNYYSCINI